MPGQLDAIGGDLERALEDVNVPSYLIDASGVVRWLNEAACRLVGDVCGRQFTSVLAPEDTRRSREIFARKLVGNAPITDAELTIMTLDNTALAVEVSSVPLRSGGRVVGVFGQVLHMEVEQAPHAHPHLTARQTEVLHLLEH